MSDCNEVDESNINAPSTSKKRKSYKQKYSSKWKEKINWLKENADGNVSCICCNRTIIGGLSHIQRHEKTLLHRNKFIKAKNTPKISEVLQDKGNMNLCIKTKEAELKCVMFLHEHNLPFILMDHFSKFLSSVFSDSEIAKNMNIARTKATSITKNCFATEALRNITKKIEDCEAYSIYHFG